MTKRSTSMLRLYVETVRSLSSLELSSVQGGAVVNQSDKKNEHPVCVSATAASLGCMGIPNSTIC